MCIFEIWLGLNMFSLSMGDKDRTVCVTFPVLHVVLGIEWVEWVICEWMHGCVSEWIKEGTLFKGI